MDKEILTFGDIQIEKDKFYYRKSSFYRISSYRERVSN